MFEFFDVTSPVVNASFNGLDFGEECDALQTSRYTVKSAKPTFTLPEKKDFEIHFKMSVTTTTAEKRDMIYVFPLKKRSPCQNVEFHLGRSGLSPERR